MTTFAPELNTIRALHGMLCVDGLFNRVAWSGVPGDPVREYSHDYGFADRAGWVSGVMSRAEWADVTISVGLRGSPGFGSCDGARVLWARVEGKKQADLLKAFEPVPTIVLREGSTQRFVALWELRRPLRYEDVVRANRRLAHALFAPKKWVEPEFAFAAPGSCLREGRARPVPVRAVFLEPAALYRPGQVVKRLRDAPDANAWREA